MQMGMKLLIGGNVIRCCQAMNNCRRFAMVLKEIDLNKTPLTLEELLAELSSQTEILLTREGTPLARIAAPATKTAIGERILGLHEGQGWISDDFTDELPYSAGTTTHVSA
jgi:hypothetical protein